MERFVTRYQDRIAGILTGFDRMLFRGTFRSISHPKGAEIWLSSRHVLRKDFATFAQGLTARVKAHAILVAPQRQPRGRAAPNWSLQESEFATDVLFQTPADLAAIDPALARHAIEALGSEDVRRFLGRRLGGWSTGEVTSSYLRRPEGLRVKHRVEENSLKMYDKAARGLRIEVSINQPRRFLVYRERTRHGHRQRRWGPMRKGIADLPRRVELSRAANARYLDALSVVPDPRPVHQLLDPLSQRRLVDDRPYRPLRPIAPDESARFAALLRGHTALQRVSVSGSPSRARSDRADRPCRAATVDRPCLPTSPPLSRPRIDREDRPHPSLSRYPERTPHHESRSSTPPGEPRNSQHDATRSMKCVSK